MNTLGRDQSRLFTKKHHEVIHGPLEDFQFFVIFSVLIAKQETIVVINTRLAAWGFALIFC